MSLGPTRAEAHEERESSEAEQRDHVAPEARKLFRKEALERGSRPPYGSIRLAVPVSATVMTVGALAALLGLIAFAYFGTFTKAVRIPGIIAPETGLLRVYSQQVGTIQEKLAVEGMQVNKGEELFVLTTDRTTLASGELQAGIRAELERRLVSLQREMTQTNQLFEQQGLALTRRSDELAAELRQIGADIAVSERRLKLSEETLARYERLRRDSFISDAQLQQRKEEVLDQQARLGVLERGRHNLQRDLQQVEADRKALPLRRETQLEGLSRLSSEIRQNIVEGDSRSRLVVAAPESGSLSSVLVERGQTVTSTTLLGVITPRDAQLHAQLFAPSRAIAHVKPGQRVWLRLHAFPYQKFGHQEATVSAVSTVAIQPAEFPVGIALPPEPQYRISAALKAPAVRAYGTFEPLRSGMLLDADVQVERRRVYEWIFEPILSFKAALDTQQ